VDEALGVRIEGDGLVVERTMERCGCRPEVRRRAGGPVAEYRCDCGNELLVGHGASAMLSELPHAITGHHVAMTPGGEAVEIAWLSNLEEL
jgi:hypothetical protein